MTPLENARYAADTVRLKAEEWQGYEQRFPWIVNKIKLSIDEYAYFGGGAPGEGVFGRTTMKQALAYSMVLNEMMRYTNFLTMGGQTIGVSLIDYNKTVSTMNALGLLYEDVWQSTSPAQFQLSLLAIRRSLRRSSLPVDRTHQQRVPAARPIRLMCLPLSGADKKSLIVSVANATDADQKLDLNLSGSTLAGTREKLADYGNKRTIVTTYVLANRHTPLREGNFPRAALR